MKKVITFTTFFLLPFVTLTAFAQFELPKYELPCDHIITYEIEDPDQEKTDKTEKKGTLKYLLIFILVFMGVWLLVEIIGLIHISANQSFFDN